MRRFLLLSACLAGIGAAVADGASVERVACVSDGDTIVLTNRAHVRLLQIDSPEVGSGECYPAQPRAL
jgi:endonuclease YncB( thermonuclease family)